MKKTILLITLLIVSNFLGLCVFIYSGIDHGVTMAYHNDSYKHTSQALEQAIVIANGNVIGKNIAQVRSLVGKGVSGIEPFIKEGCFYTSGLCLKINEDQIVDNVQLK